MILIASRSVKIRVSPGFKEYLQKACEQINHESRLKVSLPDLTGMIVEVKVDPGFSTKPRLFHKKKKPHPLLFSV